MHADDGGGWGTAVVDEQDANVELLTNVLTRRAYSVMTASDVQSTPRDTTTLCARIRSLSRRKREADDLDTADGVIVNLALTIEAGAQDAVGHSGRVADYATAVGAQVGLGTDDLAALGQGAFLHDIGKVSIPDTVLLKTDRLTACERQLIERHPVIGDELCGKLNVPPSARLIVRSHHERLDGSGYPDGLRGDAIPLLAQITSIVDTYDALTSDRPYRRAWSREQACEELRAEVRRGWRRADLVEEFINLPAVGMLSPAAMRTRPNAA